jgi:hypothetical protein
MDLWFTAATTEPRKPRRGEGWLKKRAAKGGTTKVTRKMTTKVARKMTRNEKRNA